MTKNRYEDFIDSNESNTNECNNDDAKLSNNVIISLSSQVNIRNDNIKKDQHKHKNKTKIKILQGL